MDAPSDLHERLLALPAVRALVRALGRGGERPGSAGAGPAEGKACAATALGLHAVGGAVRDLLLGRTPHELDLAVEADAVALARKLGPVAAAHERFGTATVRLGDAIADLASTRTETYPRPGALPEVTLGASLEDDLARRDFTVNAIAVSLGDGRVTAVSGAFADLAAGRLRVLHPRSFADDPTRLLRGARYAARLGFAYDEETERLAGEALAGGALATVTPARLGAELRLALLEPLPAALERLPPELLHPAYAPDAGLVERALALAPPDVRSELVALRAAAQGVPPEALAARLRELGLPGRDVSEVTGPVAGAVVAAARGDASARRWLEVDRHRRLAITGDDLLAAGLAGPAVGRGLEAARAAMLAGAAPDREAQLAAALAV